MKLDRREVLRFLAGSAAVRVIDSLLGCAHPQGSAPSVEGGLPLNSRPLLTLKLVTSAPRVIAPIALGSRTIFPVTGGEFDGPRLRGKVLPGGGDWTLLRPDQVLELDLRVTLKTDDGALIFMTFTGLRHGPPKVIAALGRGEEVDPEKYYFRTAPRFETASEKYAYLNKLLAIGTGENRPSGPVHVIDEIL